MALSRRDYAYIEVPVREYDELKAEVERLRETLTVVRDALGPGDDEDSDSAGNMAFAIISAALNG
jgi:hypothetical protein